MLWVSKDIISFFAKKGPEGNSLFVALLMALYVICKWALVQNGHQGA